MTFIIDTNVAINLRDGEAGVAARIRQLSLQPMISALTRVELEGGVYRNPDEAAVFRSRLDLMLTQFEQLPFTSEEASVYGRIVEQCGYSRAKVIDRMIAATAIVAGATLITLNPRDFRAIHGLQLEDWSIPLPLR